MYTIFGGDAYVILNELKTRQLGLLSGVKVIDDIFIKIHVKDYFTE